MLGRLIPFALIAQCNAYARVSIPVTGQALRGEGGLGSGVLGV